MGDVTLEAPGSMLVAAGNTLTRLGDPRPEVMTLEGMQVCIVPKGPFWMGSSDQDEMADKDEKPLHQLDIPYDYWVARYPVTNIQFQAFIDAVDGYRQDSWWTTDGLKWRRGRIAPDRGGGRTAPDKRAGVSYLPNEPVVMVKWYEAVAFTNWLTAKLRDQSLLPENWIVRLPSEAEWEKAARGGLQIPSTPIIISLAMLDSNFNYTLVENPNPQRRYPWGNVPDSDKANIRETGIGRTSPVGCFVRGTVPYGVEEMSGNVWEWCSTIWRSNYQKPADDNPEGDAPRVLRGGAFGFKSKDTRCTSRSWYSPLGIYSNLGFRIVIASSYPVTKSTIH